MWFKPVAGFLQVSHARTGGDSGSVTAGAGRGLSSIASTLTLPASSLLVMPICHRAGISIKPQKKGSEVMQTRW